MANDAIEVQGSVVEMLWWWNYKVYIEDMDLMVTAYAAWKMKRFNIKIIPWDIVNVELSPYEPTKWRIVYRTIDRNMKKSKAAKIASLNDQDDQDDQWKDEFEALKD
jgi:translation initiation factor IF-1